MLITFSITNFRSFAAEETFSMVASSRFGDHIDHLCPIPNSTEKALRAAVMYGANGAGKSNLYKALKTLKNLVLQQRKKGTGIEAEPFRFGAAAEATTFDVQFVVAGKLYRYFCKFNFQYILEEFLAIQIAEQEELVFERVTSD
ncbi:MAG: AAA family ATPase, partial [Burkholderiales bacterium]|nr:AAA family ATPase [Burkholderiales bacterium]